MLRELFSSAMRLLGCRVRAMEIEWPRWRRAGLWILVVFVLRVTVGALYESSGGLVLLDLHRILDLWVLVFLAWLGVGFLGLVGALRPPGRTE